MSDFKPTIKAYSAKSIGLKRQIKRRARFAPQLLADGLTSGIVSDQANLVHGAFDDGTDVDPFANIHSDKFDLMNSRLNTPSVDPGATSNEVNDTPSE